MARETSTPGNITSGKLSVVERQRFIDAIAALGDGPVTISIKRIGPKRTLSQQAYYRGVVVPMLRDAINDAWGEDLNDEEVHELLKRQFNTRTIETENGHTVKLAMSTTRLDTAEYVAYVEKCRRMASQFFNLDIPDPVKILSTKDQLNV